MSYKIEIPEVSEELKDSVYEFLQNEDWDFYELLRVTGDWLHICGTSFTLKGIGGGPTPEEQLERATLGLHYNVLKDFLPLLEAGYTAGDFQHVLLDVYMEARMEAVMCGALGAGNIADAAEEKMSQKSSWVQ